MLLSDALSSNVGDFNSVNSYFEINPVNKTEEGKFVEDTTRTQSIPNTSNENVSPINGSEKETTVTKTEVEETPKLKNTSSQRTEEQKKKSISLLDAINDLDDDQILFRVTTPNKKQESQSSTIEREKRWLEKALPQFSKEDKLKIISGLITVANKGTKAWGMYHKGIITLSDIAANGTLYHEAFHAVFDTSLTEEEKASLLDEAKKIYGNKSNRELEEDLAEGFREYMQNQDEKGLLQRIKNFFRDLYYKVTNWKKIYPNIQGYYRMINQGKFKNINLQNKSQEQILYKEEYTNPYNNDIEISLDIDTESADINGFGSVIRIFFKGDLIGSIPLQQQIKKIEDFKFTKYVDVNDVAGSTYIESEFRGKGFGKSAYWELGMWLSKHNSILRSATDNNRTEAATKMWQALERDGFAKKVGNRYEFINNTSKVIDKNGEPRFITNDRLQEKTSYREEEYTQEMKDILANAPRNKQGQLLAPNGKVSNLTERQYAQVRTKDFKKWFGDWENVNTFITNLDNSRVEIEISSNKNEHEGNKTLKIYIKGQKNKGHFELVKDREFAQYSVHFKTNKDKLQPGDTKILFEELSKAIPDGAIVSTWGSLSEDGIRALPNIGRGMQKIGERTATKKSDNSTINIPIYQKGEGVSKVIDENGEPRVVYAGYRDENFYIFDTKRKGIIGQTMGQGSYFSPRKQTAEQYTFGQPNKIKEVFLNIRNPWKSETNKTAKWTSIDTMSDELEAQGYDGTWITRKQYRNFAETRGWPILQDLNDDGTIIELLDEIVVYNPNQIKSATDNIGTFSSENDDIRYREISKEELDRQYELAKKIVKELNNRRYNTKEEAENAFRNSGIPMKFFNGLTQLNANNSVGYKIKLITKDYYNKHLEELMEKPKQYKNPTIYMESIKPTEKYNFYSLDPDIQMELYNDGIDKETFDSFSRDLQEQFLHCL